MKRQSISILIIDFFVERKNTEESVPSCIGYYLKNDYRIKYLVFCEEKSWYYIWENRVTTRTCDDDNDDSDKKAKRNLIKIGFTILGYDDIIIV